MEKLIVSKHAKQRMSQRNLTTSDIAFVMQFGRLVHRTGIEFYFLAKRDIPKNLLKKYHRLNGTTLLITNSEILTAYRNIKGYSVIRRKLKQSVLQQRFEQKLYSLAA